MTQTRSGKIFDPKPKHSKRDNTGQSATAVQDYIEQSNIANDSLADGYVEKPNGTQISAEAHDTILAAEEDPAFESVPSTTNDITPDSQIPTPSTMNAASTCVALDFSKTAPPTIPTQPIITAANEPAPDSSTVGDIASMCSPTTAQDQALSNPSSTEELACKDSVPTKPTIDAAPSCKATSHTENDASQVAFTEPINAAVNESAPNTCTVAETDPPIQNLVTDDPCANHARDNPTSTKPTTDAENETESVARERAPPILSKPNRTSTSLPSTRTAAVTELPVVPTDNPAPASSTCTVPRVFNDALKQSSTTANNNPEVDLNGAESFRSSVGIANRTTGTSDQTALQPVVGRRTRGAKRPRRRVRNRGAEPLITKPNHKDDPIIIDDEADGPADTGFGMSADVEYKRSLNTGDGDIPSSSSIKQVLRTRQQCVEKMKQHLDDLLAYLSSTPDGDQSGDFSEMRVGQKRSFAEFITAELDDSDQPKIFARKIIGEIEEYQGMLRCTKAIS